MSLKIKQWHLYLANLNPQRGTETGKVRPVLVVQSDLLNAHHPSTIIIPLTSNVIPNAEPLRLNAGELQYGLEKDSDFLIDQIRTIDNKRFFQELGKISPSLQHKVKKQLLEVLDWA